MRKFALVLIIGAVVLSFASSITANPGTTLPTSQMLTGLTPIRLEAAPGDLAIYTPPPAEFLQRRPASATFIVNYYAAGTKMWAGTSYEVTCETWPTDAQIALNYAVSIWATQINSSVPIKIDVCWGNTGSPSNLGRGGPNTIHRDFVGAPKISTWYVAALANALSGTDLNGSTSEIMNAFNSTRSDWHFGTGSTTPAGKYNFASVALHEIGHGLGFLGFMSYSSGVGYWGYQGYPSAYDHFTENGAGTALLSYPSGSTALGTQLTSDNIYFDGPNANAANSNTRPKLYAPATWASGSSYSHLDETTFNGTVNALMTPFLNAAETIYHPGPVTLGILRDIGWTLASATGYKVYLPLVLKDYSPLSWVTLVNTTFEGDFPGPWVVFDNNGASYGDYRWAARTCRPYAGSYSGWAVGGGADGSARGCGSNYPNYANSWMRYGPFSLVGATAADLKFKLWLNTESGYDRVCHGASIDGTSFYGSCDSGYSSGWIDRTLDLSNVYTLGNLLGQPNVWVVIFFYSDSSVNYSEGGYVDNVVLRKCPSGTCPASASQALPSGARITEFPMQATLPKSK